MVTMGWISAAVMIVTISFTGASMATSSAQTSDSNKSSTIPDPNWFTGWRNEFAPPPGPSSSSRRLKQAGVLPPGHSGSSSCNVSIVGTGKTFGVKSAKVTCTTTDKYWLSAPYNGVIRAYAGRPLYDLYKSQPQNWQGIRLQLPNEPNFFYTNNTDPILFWVQMGKINFTGSVTNMSVVDWAVMLIENGTEATFNNFAWKNNVGQRFPTLAAARSTVNVYNSVFVNNVCTNATRCHTPGIYISEGERATIVNNTFSGGRAHLTGALMITAGALANVSNNVFTNNSVVVYGAFGGAIFHDECDSDPRTYGGRSEFRNNTFTNNFSNGFGGAIRLGSYAGGCPKTIVSGNVFKNNQANLTGGAIFVSYCHGVRPQFSKNQFIGNTATKFNGQIGYNPLKYPSNAGAALAGKPTPTGNGCQQPLTTNSTFSGNGTKNFSPVWYFP